MNNRLFYFLITATLPAISCSEEEHHQHLMHNHQQPPFHERMSDTPKPAHSEHHHHLPVTPTHATLTPTLINPHEFDHLPKAHMGDEDILASISVDRLEMANVRDNLSMTYDWQAWLGKDYDRLVVRAEGEIDQGHFKNARNEILWGHAFTSYWDTQVGVRIDSGLGHDRLWAAFGVQGFAPYWLYIEATAYVGEEGRTAFRLESEYDLRITQKLILQPRVELNFYSQRDDSRLVSSGLSNYEAGLRLRYEITRKIAPYIGVEWSEVLGTAANIMKKQNNNADETRFVAGVHFWF